jgi:hypothetical protein
MIYTIYTIQTGQIVGVVQSNDIQVQLTDGQAYLEGYYSDTQFYVENNVPVAMPTRPTGFVVFDYQTKSWIADIGQASATVLSQRFNLLAESDWTQIPNNPLTTEKQAAWATYRQELRDITQQSGYPLNVVWPVAPI